MNGEKITNQPDNGTSTQRQSDSIGSQILAQAGGESAAVALITELLDKLLSSGVQISINK